MELIEAMQKLGYEYETTFSKLVSMNTLVSGVYKHSIRREAKAALDKKALIQKHVDNISGFFIEGKEVNDFRFDRVIDPLIKYGFKLSRERPLIKVVTILNDSTFRDMHHGFAKSDVQCRLLGNIDEKYQGAVMREVDYSDAVLESLYYAIIGGDYAVCFEFLKEVLSSSKKLKSFVDGTGKAQEVVKIRLMNVYDWKYKDEIENIRKLYEGLKGVFIDEKTKLIDFEKIFSGCKFSDITNPIKWVSSSPMQVLHLITELENREFIYEIKDNRYNRLKACFVNSGGEVFEANFAQMKAKKASKGYTDEIAQILKKFKSGKLRTKHQQL